MKLLSILTFAATAATVALAMPSDQAEAKAVASAAPPATEGEFSYDQYMSLSLEERKSLVDLLNLLEQAAAAGANRDELTTMARDNLTGPWAWIKCKVCTKAIGFFVGKITKYGCGKVTVFSATICEFAGLGPEDPLADVCAAAIIAACPVVAKQIAKKVTHPNKLCKAIDWCN